MSAIKFIQGVARKSLTKNQGSGITTIPGAMQSESKAAEIVALLQRAGIPMNQLDDFIRSEADVLKFLNIIEAASKPKVYSGQAAVDQLNKLFPKKGEVVEFPQKTSFKEQIEAMKKSGDIVDPNNLKKNDNVLTRELFRDSTLNKEPVNEKFIKYTIQDINKKDPIEGMKIANKIIKREGPFKDLTEAQSQRILKETDDHLTGRDMDYDPEDFYATGGRAGFYTGGITDVEPSLDDIGHGTDALMSRTRLMSPGAQATTSTGLNYLLAEDNDNMRVPFKYGLKVYPKIEASKSNQGLGDGKNVDLQDLTYGGTLMYDQGPFSAGIEYLKGKDKFDFKDTDDTLVKDTTDRELANLILMMKLKNGSIKFKGNKDNQMINLSKSFAQGGRIGFAGGGMGRRAFLKLLASIGGGVAAAKSGILGLGKGAGKQVTKEVAKEVATGSGTVPPYFLNLVKKIKNLGDDVTQKAATQDRQVVKQYKDFEMTEDVTTGEIQIFKKSQSDEAIDRFGGENATEEVFMRYKPSETIIGKNNKPVKTGPEYEENTSYISNNRENTGGILDDVDGVPDDVIKEGTIFEDTLSEFGKAEGGRIGYGIGGLSKLGITGSSRRFLEKIFGKGNLDEMIKRDPEMHRGLLEVTEMFRNRDKEGLKAYMKNFLPHMDDTQIEEFIVGDAVDSAGQAKFGLGDMQGQLIRLGSGRDYKAKIEAIKKLEDAQKLDTLDVTEEMIRKPNAFGGIQTMLGE